MHVLDNPAWHALPDPSRRSPSATRRPSATTRRSRRLRRCPTNRHLKGGPPWASSSGREAWPSCSGRRSTSTGWEQLFAFPIVQMVATSVDARRAPDARTLGLYDVPDMLAARAGHRARSLNPPDHRARHLRRSPSPTAPSSPWRVNGCDCRVTPRSAPCAPTPASGGAAWLGSSLVRHLVDHIELRGDTPFLHVLETNTAAIRPGRGRLHDRGNPVHRRRAPCPAPDTI